MNLGRTCQAWLASALRNDSRCCSKVTHIQGLESLEDWLTQMLGFCLGVNWAFSCGCWREDL